MKKFDQKSPSRFLFLERPIYYTLLASLFTMAIAMRAKLPAIPFLDNDSWGYLQPTLSMFFDGKTVPTFRSFLYPLLLWVILSIHANFVTLSIVQHSAGVLAALILLISWHRMRVFLPEGPLIRILHRVGALVITIIYLFPKISILMEHSIRPEALFPLNIAICLWIATEFSRSVWLEKRFRFQEVCLGIALIFFSFAGYFLKPAWGAGALCALLPLFASVFWLCGYWIAKLAMLGGGAFLVYALLVVPEERKHRMAGADTGFQAQTLFSSHGEIIYDLLREDVQSLPHDAVKHRMLQSLDRVIASRMRLFYGYTRLHPDDILYRGPLNELEASFGGNMNQVKAFCYEYYLRAWKKYPFRMLEKIRVQLWYFYSPKRCSIFDPRSQINVPSRMERCKQVLLDCPSYAWPPFQEYTNKVFALQNATQAVMIPPIFLFLGRILNSIYFPALVLMMAAAIALHFGWLEECGFRRGSIWGLYLFSYNLGNSFTIAFVHVMGVSRYHFNQTLFSIIGECFALVFLVALIFAVFVRLKGRYSKIPLK